MGDTKRTLFTITLQDPAARNPSLTGGKGANLARLLAADVPIPAGVCVTTAAYRALIDDPEIQSTIRSLNDLEPNDTAAIGSISADVRSRIQDREFPETVRESIIKAVTATDTDACAVRSSATAEDLPTASFAGQHDTFLAVRGEEAIIERIRDCMASLFTDRAVTYRLRNGISHSSVSMAVVVQEMVEPAVAGVLFTADPVSGNRQIASIDASFGLGEAIVAGEVSPDNVRVDRRTGEVIEYEVGEKGLAIRLREGDTGGTERVDVSPEERTARALTNAQVRALVDLGEQVETLLGAPQDIEWAFVDGEPYILQSRPITSLFPLVSPRPQDDLLHVYLSVGHQQAMPEALPPLVLDFWRSFIDHAAKRFRNPKGGGLSGEAGNRIYVDLTPLARIGPLRRGLPTGLSKLSEPAADGLRELLSERRNDIPQRGRKESLLIGARVIRRGNAWFRSVVPRVLAQLTRSLVFGLPDVNDLWEWSRSWGEEHSSRIRSPKTTRGRVRATFETVDLTVVLREVIPKGGAFLPGIIAGGLLWKMFPDADEELDAIGKGFENELVTRMNQELGELADLARDSPAVVEALDAAASVDEIRETEGGRLFVEAFDAFIDRFGHRATGEIDLSRPRWRDDPSVLLRTIHSNAKQGSRGRHREHLRNLEHRASTAQNQLESRVIHGLLGPVRAWFVRRMVTNYRTALSIREFPKNGMAYVFAAVHDILIEAGETLAARGQIDRPDDVWFLRRDELLAALNDEPRDVDVDSRRRVHNRYSAMTAPPLLTSEGEYPTASQKRDVKGNALAGTAVSSGVVEGTAHVIRDPSGVSLEPGEILVAPSTDPGWTPLFLNAAGLVMEVGGRMTHGALVAREYGIPAVASVADATTTVKTGERIRVDGKRGVVVLLDRE